MAHVENEVVEKIRQMLNALTRRLSAMEARLAKTRRAVAGKTMNDDQKNEKEGTVMNGKSET